MSTSPDTVAGSRPTAGRGCLFWAALVSTMVAVGPPAIALLASIVADANGCTLNEAQAHSCIVAGTDIGEPLAAAFLLGWLTIATIWLVPVAIVLWIVRAMGRRRKEQ